MRVQDIEIHVGEPDFPFTPIRQLEAKCEATTMFSGAPTMDEVNAKLREMAAGLGANAVVRVEYKSGVSMTSWRSMKGTGLAVNKLSDEMPCPVCAETIKRAAVKCRFCGSEISEDARSTSKALEAGATQASAATAPQVQVPLRATNNPQWWIFALIGVAVLLWLLSSM
jgi:hypothetical protein